MMTDEEFLNTKKDEQCYKVVAWLLRLVNKNGLTLSDMMSLENDEVADAIMQLHPKNIQTVTNMIYVLNLYCADNGLTEKARYLSSIDRLPFFRAYKIKYKPKSNYLSNEEYEDLINDVSMYEEMNAVYYTSLFGCIWHGLYNNDLSCLKNLRGECIDEESNTVTVTCDDGSVMTRKLPSSLIDDLMELANRDYWERKNRYGIFHILAEGLFHDSVFKIENRSTGNNYRDSYFARIRKINKEYSEREIRPKDIYISGIMNRLRIKAESIGMKLGSLITAHTPTTREIIQKELDESYYPREMKYFIQSVVGNIDSF